MWLVSRGLGPLRPFFSSHPLLLTLSLPLPLLFHSSPRSRSTHSVVTTSSVLSSVSSASSRPHYSSSSSTKTGKGTGTMVLDQMETSDLDSPRPEMDIRNANAKDFCSPITDVNRESWRKEFYSDPKNVVSLQACTKMDPLEVCLSRSGIENTNNVFTHKIDQEGKPVSNQKSSGRCWLFAFLNSIRVPFMKEYNIDEFEFSQAYLFFWDKVERCNHHLNNVVRAWKKGEKLDGRLMGFLLHDPISDGGQWGMAVNLIHTYGLMPKKNFPESFSSESSGRLNTMLRSKLREFSKVIRDILEETGSENQAQEMIQTQMKELYQMIGICLGVPTNEFVWEYYDKSKTYHKIGPITPQEFYKRHVKPVYDVDTKICLVHDPRNAYSQTYVVEYLGNMVTGNPTIYNNQPVDLLLNLTADAIKAGEVVWFGCEVSKRFAAKQGIEDLKIHDYKSVFGMDVALGMDKADRLRYGESCMSHAMVFTGVSMVDTPVATNNGSGSNEGDMNEQHSNDALIQGDTPVKFRVENSWGEDRGDKGYLVMTADWYREFVFEVVIDKIHLPLDVIETSEKIPTVLPAWDPMGTLACKNCSEQGTEHHH